MIKNITYKFLVLFFIIFIGNAHSYVPAGLQELNYALTLFVEENEAEGLQALQESAKEGNYIAALLHHLKGIKVPKKELHFESPDILQKIETLFWQRDYGKAFDLALQGLSQFPDLRRELKIFQARSWFMRTKFGNLYDVDEIFALYYWRFWENKKSDLAIEMAIVDYWRGWSEPFNRDNAYNIDWALHNLDQVQDPEYILTADLLRVLLQKPNFLNLINSNPGL